MRVTHVITRLIVGGAQENTIASVIGLRKKPDLEVNLVSGPARGREGSLEAALGASRDVLMILPELVRPIQPWKDFLALQRLSTMFQKERPEVVHTHSGKAGILGRLAAARAKVPIIIHTIHGPSFGAFQGRMANLILRGAEGHAGKVTTHFVVVAEAMKEQYLAAGIGSPELYTKIFSGFDLQPFLSATNDVQLRAKFGISPDDFVIGKIARLFKLKGHDDLLAIAPGLLRDCPRVKFLLVGDGPWRERLEMKVRELGLKERFIFSGLVEPKFVPGLIGIMDVVAHLSLREGLARSLPQALAVGRPVVAYDCDGAKEVCKEGETGFLLRPGDLAGLRAHLLRLANDAALRDRLGKKGRGFVMERFGVERMVDDLHRLYLRLESSRRMG
jgi:glycosyltransferase involved in cell wall biosynthesis